MRETHNRPGVELEPGAGPRLDVIHAGTLVDGRAASG